MTAAYSFCPAMEADRAALFGLYANVMKPYITAIWGWDQAWQERDFQRYFRPENLLVAWCSGEIAGFSQVEPRGDHVFVRMLVVAAAHRCNGLGSRLLEDGIRRQGAGKRTELEVFKINESARRFYEARGFRRRGDTEVSYVLWRPGVP